MKRANERNLASERKEKLNSELGWILIAAIKPSTADVYLGVAGLDSNPTRSFCPLLCGVTDKVCNLFQLIAI